MRTHSQSRYFWVNLFIGSFCKGSYDKGCNLSTLSLMTFRVSEHIHPCMNSLSTPEFIKGHISLVYTPVIIEPFAWPFNPPLHRGKWHGFQSKASYLLPIKQLHRFHCIQIKLPFYLVSIDSGHRDNNTYEYDHHNNCEEHKFCLNGLWKSMLINDENVERLWAIIANIKWHCRWRGVSGCNYTTRQLSASNLSLGSPKV